MKLPRKLKKALKKEVNKKTGNAWDTREIKILNAGPTEHIAPGRRKKFTTAKGYAVLASKLSAR